ncbi:MAG: tripartite tricarboxylate transporter substrate binding protein [Betaproteobacteria bacterium]|jgi:tripartite-type tricarboxylate transporter receptor subunit TctC|nr:tripartite tricarboxylate transporter substrate binding protein [Betaproteobacteria bacterium]
MSFLPRVLVAVAFSIGASHAADQLYPIRPVRMIVSNATGSSPEITGRIVANKLTVQTGQQFVVDARPGASGIIGVELVKAAAPDGYTVLVGSTTVFAGLPALKPNLSYDIERDFLPLTRIASVANVMVIQASLGVTNVAAFIKYAQANPGKLNCGHSGNGTPAHLAAALFNVMAKVDIQHVPYKGAAQALSDLIAGHIQCQFTSPVVAMPHAKGGRVRVLATTGLGPDPLAPDLPTVAETVPGYESTQWFGIALPVRTPKPIVSKLHAEIMRALRSPEVSELLSKQGATVQPESPAAFAQYIREERNRIAGLAKGAGIRID